MEKIEKRIQHKKFHIHYGRKIIHINLMMISDNSYRYYFLLKMKMLTVN